MRREPPDGELGCSESTRDRRLVTKSYATPNADDNVLLTTATMGMRRRRAASLMTAEVSSILEDAAYYLVMTSDFKDCI